MCVPIWAVGLALSAASMAAKANADSQVSKARNDVMQAESIRQKGFQKEADALNAQSQDRYKDFQGAEDSKAQQLSDLYKGQNQATPDAVGAPTETVPMGSSNVVTREVAKQGAKAKAFGDQQGDALGNLRAFGDVLGTDSRLQARDAAQIGTVGGFMKGSAGVEPLELEAANSKGGGMRMLGDVLGLGGSALSMYGLGSAGAASTLAKTGAAAKVATAAPAGFNPNLPFTLY